MKYITKPISLIMIISIVHLLSSCHEFLDEKPEKSIVVPRTLEDLQRLLDASRRGMNQSPGIGLLSSDDLVSTDNGFLSYTTREQNAYLWQEEIFEDRSTDWNAAYLQVFYANVVLESLEDINAAGEELQRKNEIQGSALFIRANAFFNLLTIFAPNYVRGENDNKLGIPLRLSPDINIIEKRSSLARCYQKITDDLHEAIELLPETPVYKSRPSIWAAYALLARVYLATSDYEKALDNAQMALNISSTLIDFNQLDTGSRYPFELFNEEVIYHTEMVSYKFIRESTTTVNPELMESFAENDLRRAVFFRSNSYGMDFKGTYSGTVTYFSGLATDEVYLIKSESLARLGEKEEALEVLHQLLQKRWVSGTFEPMDNDNVDVLSKILEERRKELVCRGLRWSDLKRLNNTPEDAVTLKRTLSGKEYVLEPGSSKYVLPIPPDEVNISGIVQNDRS